MNLKDLFTQLSLKLTPHVGIWENEILMQYPNPFVHYRSDWLDFLEQASEEVKLSLEKKNYQDLDLPQDLKQHAEEMQSLCRLPEFDRTITEHPFEPNAFLKMKPKKQYEIKILTKAADQLMRDHHLSHVIDIGGGVGFLAQSLSNYYLKPVTSIDMDATMQKTGRERNEQNQKKGSSLVNYVQAKLELGNSKLVSLFSKDSLSLGLHTCGELANTHFQMAVKGEAGALINFGCCYYKLSYNNCLNVSQFAKENPHLDLNMYALTLATLAHKQTDQEVYQNKNIVKRYRYSLHLYLHDMMGLTDFQALGNSHYTLYQGDFGHYALEQMSRLGIEHNETVESFNQFFEDEKRSRLVKRMILSGILRGIYGRPLEMYVLVDRALYLEENGYQVALIPYFEEEISPRNIGIRAIRQ
ncbi:MAG: methyltransferase [Bacteriovoracaceae bacterium]